MIHFNEKQLVALVLVASAGIVVIMTSLLYRLVSQKQALVQQNANALKKIELLKSSSNIVMKENVEYFPLGSSADGTLEARLKVVYNVNELSLIISSHTNRGAISVKEFQSVELWKGTIPIQKADLPTSFSVIRNSSSITFSGDGTKVAFKAPDQSIHLWEISEEPQEVTDGFGKKKKILVKKESKIQTISRVDGVSFDEKAKYGMGMLLYSGDGKELYGILDKEGSSRGIFQLYPKTYEIDQDLSLYPIDTIFSIPKRSGFGFVPRTGRDQKIQLAYWQDNKIQLIPLDLYEQVISVLIAPNGANACITVYSDRMNDWWMGWSGSDQLNVSTRESRLYNLNFGNELVIRMYPYECDRWITNDTVLVKNDLYYSLNINTFKYTYLVSDPSN